MSAHTYPIQPRTFTGANSWPPEWDRNWGYPPYTDQPVMDRWSYPNEEWIDDPIAEAERQKRAADLLIKELGQPALFDWDEKPAIWDIKEGVDIKPLLVGQRLWVNNGGYANSQTLTVNFVRGNSWM